jgi:hypothetical protein
MKYTLSLFLLAATTQAGTLYQVTVDTSSLAASTTGFIDLAFNGGYPATATISGYGMTGGSLNAGTINTFGTISGTLPGTVMLNDDNADYDEGLTFGTSLSFNLTLSGVPSGTVGDVFTLSFFNSTFTGGLLTGNLSDFWIAQFQMDTKGNVTATAYPNPTGGQSFATINAVPEPGVAALAITGFMMVLVTAKRRKSTKGSVA